VTDPRRALPSVTTLLEAPAVNALLAEAPRAVVVAAIRDVIDHARLDSDSATRPRELGDWADAVARAVAEATRSSLRSVINATGVVLHTNLGRAPLADVALRAIQTIASGYSNLEYDVDRGERGSRYTHCASLLCELTGAEDALVVNNNAAAVILALNTLADEKECIVSRGELVEIGGSFRVPDMMAKSGARLIEVGTTNRTHIADYAGVLGDDTGAIIKVHRSNFTMEGFVAEADASSLAALGRERGVPVIHDLGSGLLISLDAFGLRGEPTARDALGAGVTVVTMSGDKLLGGPQAGIVVGRREAIAAMRKNPLTRAFRVDKLTLAALEATLALYRDPDRARREIPVLAQLTASVAELGARARRVLDLVRDASRTGASIGVAESEANVGGGAFPGARIPSVALVLDGPAAAIEARLRLGSPAVIGRVHDGRLFLDLRTVLPRDEDQLVRELRSALA
jgi:L-seryl-tRNA(Ser) seleniumtransferase